MNSLSRLLPYLRAHRFPFWAGMLALLVARVFEALIPLCLKDGIDRLAVGDAAIGLPAAGIFACLVLRFATIVWGRRHVRQVGVEVAFDLRRRLYAHFQRQGPGFFARHPTGDLMARAINDLQLVRQMVGQGTRSVLVLVFSGAVAFSFMLGQSVELALFLLVPTPLIAVVAWVLARRVFNDSIAVQEQFSTLSERVQENLNGIRTIQAQAREEQEERRFEGVNGEYADRYHALLRTNSLLSSWMPALGALGTLLILGAGGSRVLSGELSVGTFAAFFWYLGMVLAPVREMGSMVNLFQRGAAAARRIFSVLDSEPEIVDRPAASAPRALRGAIELRDVHYRYPGARDSALRGVSFAVAPGETVALMGRVGSGKSTLLRLLVRLLDPDPGSVRIDGACVREIPLHAVRDQIALVPQDPFLFAATVRENVTYDEPARPEKQVWDATESADLRQSVEALPFQLEARIGERGVTLSGGQKQRSTLARGIIRDEPVLLLDDCFSSVDTETEENILSRLRAVRRGRTTLMVSHRVSTARHADRIVVLADGRILEQGTHAELLANDGFYAGLDRAQRHRGALLAVLEEPA